LKHPPCSVPDSCDLHNSFLRSDPVHDSARFADDLSDLEVVEFGDNPARFGKIGHVLNHLEYVVDETDGGDRARFGDVRREFFQVKASDRLRRGSPLESCVFGTPNIPVSFANGKRS